MTQPAAEHDAAATSRQEWEQEWFSYIANTLVPEFNSLTEKVNQMADILDTLKTDFEAYQTLVNTTLTGLKTTITNLTAGQLDPTKAAALDTEIQAAITALTPPAPTPAPAPAGS